MYLFPTYLFAYFYWCLFTDGELDIMMDHTRFMVLLAKVYEKSARMEGAMDSLTKAREMQARYKQGPTLSHICSFHLQVAGGLKAQEF